MIQRSVWPDGFNRGNSTRNKVISSTLICILMFSLANSLAPVAQGATTLSGFSDYFYTKVDVDATTKRVFAGATRNSCVNADTNQPCNSCVNSSVGTLPFSQFFDPSNTIPEVCSEQEIYPSLRFTITLRSDKGEVYKSDCSRLIMGQSSSSFFFPIEVNNASIATGVANQDVTAVFQWADICQAGNMGASCNASSKPVFSFGFNKDCADTELADGAVKFEIHFRYVDDAPEAPPACDPNTVQSLDGFCNFTVYPGDEKIFINTLSVPQNSALKVPSFESGTTLAPPFSEDGSTMIYKAARFFVVPGGQAEISAASMSTSIRADIEYSLTSGVSADAIDGLTNRQQYSMVMASVDQAGITTYFTSPANLNYNTDPLGETQSAIPEPVSGLLDGKKCFIATAAFGGELEPEVDVFRSFRDQRLLGHGLGRELVRFYYKHSPSAALWLQSNEVARVWVQSQLWFLLWIAQIILWLGWIPTVCFSGITSWVIIKKWSRPS